MASDEEMWFRNKLSQWGDDNLRSFPWRTTTDPYEILVAEVLLQKTAAEKVEPIYEHLLAAYPSPAALVDADREDIAEIIYSLGFQNQRSRALVEIGRELEDDGVPTSRGALLELPYIGQYATNATLCFAFGEVRPIVDANVVRVYNRFFDTDFEYRDEEAWQFAARMLPETDVGTFNLALLDFAATICTPRTPACEECFLRGYCDYYRQQRE